MPPARRRNFADLHGLLPETFAHPAKFAGGWAASFADLKLGSPGTEWFSLTDPSVGALEERAGTAFGGAVQMSKDTGQFKDARGFTMLEVMVVLAVMAIALAVAIPNLTSYQLRQNARGRTQQIADALTTARGKAIREGNNYFVLFHTPTIGSLTIVDDDNNNWLADSGEETTVVDRSIWTNARVTPYGELPNPPAASAVAEDGGGTIPVAPSVAVGTTFPIDVPSNTAAVGFNSRGVPVDLNTPTVWGSGQGSFYITDNENSVYAITLLPLGATRLRAYSEGGSWY